MKRFFGGGFSVFSLIMMGGSASAIPTITIDDTTDDTPTVVVSDLPNASVAAVPEQVIVTGSFVYTPPSPFGSTSISAILLDDSGTNSDFVTLTTPNTCTTGQDCPFTLLFESDGFPTFNADIPVINVRLDQETGSFQDLIGPSGLHNVFGSSIDVQVASDVPEPASLLLLSTGLLALGAVFRRRRTVSKFAV